MDPTIESQIQTLLSGNGITSENDFCDFSLSAQNEALASKGVTPTGPTDFIPLTKKTVTYIVAGVLINDKNEVLMMQEAKPSCAGQWYLPAGRMEAGENICEAVCREVLEETGIEFNPTTLIMVESANGSWFRFVFTGIVTGGSIKSTSSADSESLQAKWVKDINELHLRAKDILPLIEKGFEYYKSKTTNEQWHPNILPSIVAHKKLYMRAVIVVRRKLNNKVCILVSEKDHVHLPLCEIHPHKNVHSTIKKYMNEVFGPDLPQHRPHGLLSMEFNGSPAGKHDGLCLNLLIAIRQPLEQILLIDKYSWKEIGTSVGEELIQRLGKNLTVPLHVIR